MKNKIFGDYIRDLEERIYLEEKMNKVRLGRIVYLRRGYSHEHYKERMRETYHKFRYRKIFPDRG